ncbi:MAG: hypothetical protein RLZZ628_1778 [Bacteroidota bacterium]|jgi:hypothetical protein
MEKLTFFEANKKEMHAIAESSHGFTKIISRETGVTFTNRFFKSERPTLRKLEAVLDTVIQVWEKEIAQTDEILERKKVIVSRYRQEDFSKPMTD